jgi:hypothetical protein
MAIMGSRSGILGPSAAALGEEPPMRVSGETVGMVDLVVEGEAAVLALLAGVVVMVATGLW